MEKELINSQLTSIYTYEMYKRQLITLAENVFDFEDLPEFIDKSYLNGNLLRKGSIAFFKDDVLGVLALPYTNNGVKDVYNRPVEITVKGSNGYYKTLKQGEFVIMYDNNGRYPIYLDLIQYAERLALCQRINDINISQQKTPRIWKTDTDHELSMRKLVNQIDGMVDKVITYEDLDLDGTDVILSKVDFIADKVSDEKEKLWNEFLRLIGVANMSYTKKERNIRDEISAMQGGTIASRFSRYQPREDAVKLINEKFGTNIKVKYYDKLPSSDPEDNIVEEDESDVYIS